MLPVVLGEKGVELAHTTSDLDSEQRELTGKLSASERVIKAALPIVTDIQSFATIIIPDDIEDRIEKAAKNVELARHSFAVSQKGDLKDIEFPRLSEIEEIAATTIDGISERADSMVNAHIASRGMQLNGARWLAFGVKHMDGDSCPFCTQDTSSIDVVSAFKGYFSEAYAALVERIDALLAEVETVFGQTGEIFERILSGNSTDLTFWRTVCDLQAYPHLDVDDREAMLSGFKSVTELLKRKKANPLAPAFLQNRLSVEVAYEILERYRAAVVSCSQSIQEARSKVVTSDLTRAQEGLDRQKALKAKSSGIVKLEIENWLAFSERRSAVETEKKQAQNDLKQYVNTTIISRQKAINDLLKLFGANFQLTETKASFVGREPNADYSIAIGPHNVKAGERQDDKPSFMTLLSAGDKSTLALALFLTQVRSYPDLASSTIVFDDPFSSQDMQRQWETTSQLRALAKDACQVIVLSHDPRFLALIEKNVPSSLTCATFQIGCDNTGVGSIMAWSSEEELKSGYIKSAERIREFASTGCCLKGSTVDGLVKELRTFSEDFLRARFPGRFGPLTMFNDMTNEIEEAGSSDPLYGDVATLRAINEYTRDYMHAGAPNPDPDQLRAQCERIVSMIGSY